jgi:hypothetical protein
MSPVRQLTDWSGFVQSENFLLVSVAAAKFGARPSQLVGLRDPVLALDFDLAAAARLLAAERAAHTEAEIGLGESGAPPSRAREMNW